MRHPRDPQNGQVLDPSWTLIKDAGIGCPALSSLSIPAISLAFQEIITSRPNRNSATRVVSLNAVWPVTATFPSTRPGVCESNRKLHPTEMDTNVQFLRPPHDA